MIRALVLEDKSEILRLENQNWKAWDWTIFEKALDSNSDLHCWVIEAKKSVLGYILGQKLHDSLEILNICILEQNRKQGYGAQLMGKIIEFCKERQLDSILLEVRSKNLAAINLYKKFNFREDGVRKKYYTLPIDDAILMTLKL